MDFATAIRKSLTAFACGIVGLVPFVGVVPAVCALFLSARVRRRYRDWNPASVYLRWASVLGVLGIVVTLLAGFFVALAIVSSSGGAPCDSIEFLD